MPSRHRHRLVMIETFNPLQRHVATGSAPASTAGCGAPGAPAVSAYSSPVAQARIWCWPQITSTQGPPGKVGSLP
jgi:hypothetical protein